MKYSFLILALIVAICSCNKVSETYKPENTTSKTDQTYREPVETTHITIIDIVYPSRILSKCDDFCGEYLEFDNVYIRKQSFCYCVQLYDMKECIERHLVKNFNKQNLVYCK